MLEKLRSCGGAESERPFIVHRTMVDPRFLDSTLEPNDRQPNWCYLGVPETVNSGPVGLARFSTLRAWMSQWSVDHSHAYAEPCVINISAPLLFIENGADDAVPVSHPKCVFDAATCNNKQFHKIDDATHYYREQPQHQRAAVQVIEKWIEGLPVDLDVKTLYAVERLRHIKSTRYMHCLTGHKACMGEAH